GSPQGIITMADLVGSLVGGFDSPEDDEKKTIRQREDGSYVIDGSYQLDDFIELFNIDLTEDDEDEIGNPTSVTALVFLLLVDISEEGEQVVYENIEFQVLDMDGHRIDKLIANVQGKTSDETANID